MRSLRAFVRVASLCVACVPTCLPLCSLALYSLTMRSLALCSLRAYVPSFVPTCLRAFLCVA